MNINKDDTRQYLLSPYMLEILNEELNKMLKLGVVEPSISPRNSSFGRKVIRCMSFCFEGRKLNEVTMHDSYPLPGIDRILNLLRDAKYISYIDLRDLLLEKKRVSVFLVAEYFNL